MNRQIATKDFGCLLLAISKYQNPAWNLQYPINDMLLMRETIENVYKVPREQVHTLVDNHATKQKILQKLSWCVEAYKFILFYASCHGSQVYSISEPDYKCEILIHYSHSWSNILFDHEIKSVLSQVKERAWVIVDTCHAQSMTRSVGEKRIIAPRGLKLTRHKEVDTHKIVEIAACQENEKAYEEFIPELNKGYGLFTFNLAYLLQQSPNITLPELQERLRQRIKRQSPVITPLKNIKIFEEINNG